MSREIKFRGWWKDREGKADELIENINERPISDLRENHLIIEQFTGLHDKNGKEIYEGDIVESSTGCLATIEWRDYRWIIRGVWDGKRFIKNLTKPAAAYCCQVIGNIHENPELLK